MLQVVNVGKRYGGTVALGGVSFAVPAGEMFGLLGPNGAGKTTLLSIVSCLLQADEGEVRIQGRKLEPGDRDIRRLIGIVPQELALYGELSARENLEFFGRLYGLGGQALERRVVDVLDMVGLADRAESRVDTFSGGMKRRLNLGAALVHEPKLLLLDEPTTGVDPQSRNHIFEGVRRLNAAGTTVVYTSHYMEEVQSLCRRVGIIDHGRLIACDTLPELLKQQPGVIRAHLAKAPAELRGHIAAWPDVKLNPSANSTLEIECADVKGTLVRLVSALTERQVELISLETEEPNLERVFLHLTGHGLRD
jgi:ABC-2 type transport system ATP-binding protein